MTQEMKSLSIIDIPVFEQCAIRETGYRLSVIPPVSSDDLFTPGVSSLFGKNFSNPEAIKTSN